MNETAQKLASLEVSENNSVDDGIEIDSFQTRTEKGTIVNFLIYKMDSCFFVWVGLGPIPPTMPQLVMGAVNKFDTSSGVISSVLAHYDGDTQIAQSMSRRLSKRTNKIFYITSTIPKGDNDDLIAFVEQQIISRIQA
mmetsp:Transcript_2479/g.3417  ORF Transcript_2479/g.3417 Transcript_2479/m.3417 type:complete len:138 (+) Transcript_2479:946-1359(+)